MLVLLVQALLEGDVGVAGLLQEVGGALVDLRLEQVLLLGGRVQEGGRRGVLELAGAHLDLDQVFALAVDLEVGETEVAHFLVVAELWPVEGPHGDGVGQKLLVLRENQVFEPLDFVFPV